MEKVRVGKENDQLPKVLNARKAHLEKLLRDAEENIAELREELVVLQELQAKRLARLKSQSGS